MWSIDDKFVIKSLLFYMVLRAGQETATCVDITDLAVCWLLTQREYKYYLLIFNPQHEFLGTGFGTPEGE